MAPREPLPVDELLPAVVAALASHGAAVLTAPPGSGKSTRVPPALLAGQERQVLLLQPRRIAARALAGRIAQEQGWQLGGEVGYRVRFEKVGGERTRLWVMTEGSLTRILLADPYLEAVGTVVLDEFHERSLHLDLALAYLRELQGSVRPDLRILVMSATLAAGPLASFLARGGHGEAPVISAGGRLHPVAIALRPTDGAVALERRVADAVADALRSSEAGDVLVFLPGSGEIRACQRLLAGAPGLASVAVLPLHGQLAPAEQDAALQPGPRQRVVLATNVAETSVTIPGVRTVIDSGLSREMRFDPASGVAELRLGPISRQSADQRAGRAGRTASGRCVRLWSALADRQLAPAAVPEIQRLELSELLLVILRLGYEPGRFPFFEPPQPARLAAGVELLRVLGATGPDGRLSRAGEALAGLPLHPRLGTLLRAGVAAGRPVLGASLAALAQERDIRLRRPPGAPPADPGEADALERLALLAQAEGARHAPRLRQEGIDPQASQQVARVRDELLAQLRLPRRSGPEPEPEPGLVPRLLLAGFPDRICRRAGPGLNRASMRGEVAVEIDRDCALYADQRERGSLFVAVELARLERAGRAGVVVRQGCEIDEAMLAGLPGLAVVREQELAWDEAGQRVAVTVRWRLGALVLREGVGSIEDHAAAAALLAARLAPQAQSLVEADAPALALLRRWRYLALVRPDLGLPEPGEELLAGVIRECASGAASRAEVEAAPKLPWLQAALGFGLCQRLDELAPAQLRVPSGSAITLAYEDADRERPPVLAVRLQELFGLAGTPQVAGSIPVLLHLLAPNYRVEQVTRDLASFWANTYPRVRKDLRGRYPKHAWPEDPLAAPPQAKGPSQRRPR